MNPVQRFRVALKDWHTERSLRYVGYGAQLRALFSSPGLRYRLYNLDEVRRRRGSDTLFIIGSGPSIRKITSAQWACVSRHESFGINFSFLLDVVPTYHIMEDGKSAWHRDLTRRVLAPRRGKLASTMWFISNRHTCRLIHPRYAPELFPEPAHVCVFRMPERVLLDRDRPFVAADFARSIRYRATMSLVLSLALELGHTRIVLLGVDPQTPRHFFEDMDEMRSYMEHVSPDQLDDRLQFPAMRPKPGTYRPIDEYLYAVSELVFASRGIALMVGDPACVLAPRLRPFDGWDD